MSIKSLVDAQRELEELATSDGVDRFLKAQETVERNEGRLAKIMDGDDA